MNRYPLTLQSIEHMGADYYAFRFQKPTDLTFEEGQYGIFLHVDKQVEGRAMRAFSFASTNEDQELLIATKITSEPSSFKQQLKSLQKGDQMTVDGPMGRFLFDPSKHAVFIAGGIGITPIVSLARRHQDSPHDLSLIYSEHHQTYPFKDELDAINFCIKEYCTGVETTRQKVASLALTYQNEAVYYIAGSPSFVKGLTEQLDELGIHKEHIKFDRFTGYE